MVCYKKPLLKIIKIKKVPQFFNPHIEYTDVDNK